MAKIIMQYWGQNLKARGFKQILALGLNIGDAIKFQARSSPYKKGYRGRRDDEYLPSPSIDYGLKNPTKFVKLVEKQKEDLFSK